MISEGFLRTPRRKVTISKPTVRSDRHDAMDDTDFIDQARRAAKEIPNAEFVAIEGQDNLGVDTAGVDPILPAVLRDQTGDRLSRA
jgi:hypothetical protein